MTKPSQAKEIINSLQEDLVRSKGEVVPVYSYMSIAGILISDMERLLSWDEPGNEQAGRLRDYNCTDLVNAIRLHNWHFKPSMDAASIAFENYEHLVRLQELASDWLKSENCDCKVSAGFRSATQMPYGQLWPQRLYYERNDGLFDQRRQVEICATPTNQLLITFNVTGKKDVDFRHSQLKFCLLADKGMDLPKTSITRLQGEVVTPEASYQYKPQVLHTLHI